MVAKLKVIKSELQPRKHHRTSEVGAWLRKVVQGYYQYQAVLGNTGQLRVFCILIPTSALAPSILGKSRMRKRARTDLCGVAP
jgi:hypothetical protein